MENGVFRDVLYVPSLATNLLSIYQMTHTSSPKQVVFGPDSVEITKISTGELLVKGFFEHASKEYIFSHMPYTIPASPQLSFEADEGINIPSLPIAVSVLNANISDSDSEEESSQFDLDIELATQRDLDLDPASTSFQQPKWAKHLEMVLGIHMTK